MCESYKIEQHALILIILNFQSYLHQWPLISSLSFQSTNSICDIWVDFQYSIGPIFGPIYDQIS